MVSEAQSFRDWMLEQALVESNLERLLTSCYERLRRAGVPLDRGHFAFRTLHPLFEAASYTWNLDSGRQLMQTFPLGSSAPGFQFRLSPQYHMIQNKEFWLRRRKNADPADFPVVEDLWSQGYTDFCAYLVVFDEDAEDGVIGSFATKEESGFTPDQESLLQESARLIGVVTKSIIRQGIAENVVSTYLGKEAGRRVLTGQIGRGHHEEMTGVIWIADLRDSTQLANQLPPEDYLRMLDDYFEAVAGPVSEEGGEVLLLLGDAVLAIFPSTKKGPEEACARALAAWRGAESRVAAYNEAQVGQGAKPMAFGLGLHLGSFLFGNIGTRDRLEFTAVGTAVNLASRLQSHCRERNVRLLASADFVASARGENWHSLGQQSFQGVPETLEIFTL